jgi:hypothetical protein
VKATIYQPFYKDSWALVIGINGYTHVNKLENARADAESVAEILKKELGFLRVLLFRCSSASASGLVFEIYVFLAAKWIAHSVDPCPSVCIRG